MTHAYPLDYIAEVEILSRLTIGALQVGDQTLIRPAMAALGSRLAAAATIAGVTCGHDSVDGQKCLGCGQPVISVPVVDQPPPTRPRLVITDTDIEVAARHYRDTSGEDAAGDGICAALESYAARIQAGLAVAVGCDIAGHPGRCLCGDTGDMTCGRCGDPASVHSSFGCDRCDCDAAQADVLLGVRAGAK